MTAASIDWRVRKFWRRMWADPSSIGLSDCENAHYAIGALGSLDASGEQKGG